MLRSLRSSVLLLILFALAIAGVWTVEGIEGDEVAARNFTTDGRIAFGLCGREGSRENCVHDGDSFRLGGEKVRILSIDAPELGSGARCAAEAELGARATVRLRELLSEAPLRLSSGSRDRDQHGRLLRDIRAGGRDVGETMVREGLARDYRGKKLPWCPSGRP